MKAFLSIVCVLSAVLLNSCSVGPDYEAISLALPAHWANARPANGKSHTAPSLDAWWKNFGDPLLNRLIDEAVAGNLDVAAAKAKVREARALRREAAGALLPKVESTGSAERMKTADTTLQTSNTALQTPGAISNQFQGGFDVSWELDIFGANARAVEAAAYNEQASEEDLRTVLLTLVGDVASYYAEARGYQARIALAKSTAASQKHTAELVRAKLEAGTSSLLDTAKAEAQSHATEANVPGYEASFAQAVHRLSILTGREPGTLSKLMSAVKPIPAPRKPLPAGLPAEILRNRPDVRAAERRLAERTAKIGQAEAALYPSVSLLGAISTTGAKIGDLGRGSTIAWSWGPTLTVPIFQGGKLIAARDAAMAQRDQYFIAWHSAILTALQDVENALVSLSSERKTIKKLALAVADYRKAEELSRTQYTAGKASFLDVLDAERSAYSEDDMLLQHQVAMTKAYITLAKALGGGWSREVDCSRGEIVDEKTAPHLRGGHF